MLSRSGIIAGLFTLSLAAAATAQTTQPAPSNWNDTVQALSHALIVEEPGTAAVSSVIPDDIPIHELDGNTIETRYRLKLRSEGLSILSLRVYSRTAATFATDLAADITAADQAPIDLRRQFVPKDAPETKRCNSVAQQWIDSVLDPSPDDLIAVVVLWEPPPPVSATMLLASLPTAEPKQPFFILIKGKQDAQGQLQITQISFGDARQALK